MPANETVDFVVMFVVFGMLAAGLGSVALGWVVKQWDRYVTTAPNADAEPAPPRSYEFPLLNDEEPRTNGSENLDTLVLNAAEVEAVNRMIKHNATAAKPSKSSTIQAGFSVSRGGSAAYIRASLIYDALFGTPQPAVRYRERTPEQEALRKQLNLN